MATCKVCSQPLFLDLDPDDFDEATASVAGDSTTVPDDLELRCGCHYHWQCLLDLSSQVALSLKCPSCDTRLVSTPDGPSATNPIFPNRHQNPQILTRYVNEGGRQDNLDILPLITEEAYLEANPTARPARAYLTMCVEGDVSGITEMLHSVQSDIEMDGGPRYAAELLRYQDPLNGMKSGLHLAVENKQQEIVWLLLWLASSIPSEGFPELAVLTAQNIGAGREMTGGGIDIRNLKDEQAETAGDIAARMQGVWSPFVESGILRI